MGICSQKIQMNFKQILYEEMGKVWSSLNPWAVATCKCACLSCLSLPRCDKSSLSMLSYQLWGGRTRPPLCAGWQMTTLGKRCKALPPCCQCSHRRTTPRPVNFSGRCLPHSWLFSYLVKSDWGQALCWDDRDKPRSSLK